MFVFFFFQAEDGIRDIGVTGVQTCALPIWQPRRAAVDDDADRRAVALAPRGDLKKFSEMVRHREAKALVAPPGPASGKPRLSPRPRPNLRNFSRVLPSQPSIQDRLQAVPFNL